MNAFKLFPFKCYIFVIDRMNAPVAKGHLRKSNNNQHKKRNEVPTEIATVLSRVGRVASFDRAELQLSGVGLNTSLIAPLMGALMTNVVVSHLDLSNNPEMGDAGAELLGDLLRENPTITRLNLSRTNIGHWGIRCLARAMCVHRMVEALSFAGNAQTVDDLAAIELQWMLGSIGATHLRELVLIDTGLSIKGAVLVVEGMMQCSSLLYMPLPSRLGRGLLDEVETILRMHRSQYYGRTVAMHYPSLASHLDTATTNGGVQDRWAAPVPQSPPSSNLSNQTATWGRESTRSTALCLSLLSLKSTSSSEAGHMRSTQRTALSSFGASRSAKQQTSTLPPISPR